MDLEARERATDGEIGNLGTKLRRGALKLRLMEAGRTATSDQIKIFTTWKKDFQAEEEEVVLNRWAYEMSVKECKDLLRENSLNHKMSELQIRKSLTTFLSTTKGEIREDYLDLAGEYFKKEANSHRKKTVTTSTFQKKQKTNIPSFNPEQSEVGSESNAEGEEEEYNESDDEESPPRKSGEHTRLPNTAKLMDCVRKWGIHFSGNKNPQEAMKFLKDIKERAECYQLDINLMPRAMPELLRNHALEWFRNNKKDWLTWECFSEAFTSFFVPRRLKVQMEEDVIRYLQKPNQSIKEYGVQIQSLMRNIPDWDDSQTLDRIYENSRKEYKMYARRHDFRTLEGLWCLRPFLWSSCRFK